MRREFDSTDLRRHRLSLTAEGRKIKTRGLALISEAFAARLDRLSAAQQSQLSSLLEQLN